MTLCFFIPLLKGDSALNEIQQYKRRKMSRLQDRFYKAESMDDRVELARIIGKLISEQRPRANSETVSTNEAETGHTTELSKFRQRRIERLTSRFYGADSFEEKLELAIALGRLIVEERARIDGGSGSGNHGHEGVPGQIGGSAPKGADPVPYSSKSEKTKKLIEKRKANLYGNGLDSSGKSAERKEFVDQLVKDGVKVTYNAELDTYKMLDPHLSIEENNQLSALANWGYSDRTSDEEYIQACKDAGVTPRFHESKEEVGSWALKDTDGTPVYKDLRTKQVLTDEEIAKYSGTDSSMNPDGAKKFEQSTLQAIEKLTPEETKAIRDYTSQYGVNYMSINQYLNGTNPDDERAKEKAELITKALDKELGTDITVFRSESDLSHITSNSKVKAMLNKVKRGDFSSASKLKEELEGKEVTYPTVTSTSLNGSAAGFDQLPVQIIFKAPASAKGLDISAVSAYGGDRDEFSKAFGNSMSMESEVAFKPGMTYKIDRVDFNWKTGGKKPSGQVFITATIQT